MLEGLAVTFDGARPGERVLSDLRANRDDPWLFGALTGSAVGISKESAFLPMIEDLEARLAPDASMLVLVGETQPLDGVATAVDADDSSVLHQPLTSEQAKELSDAAGGPRVAGRLRSRSGCNSPGRARSARDAYD